ncbi:hypothetical protein OAI54_00835 [Pseudomonadales bacterium]|nr:hypothetical protein [Pseudomonadales bacterium]
MFRIAYFSVAFSIFGSSAAFFLNALAAKHLGPIDYGEAIHLVNISGLFSILISFGFQYHFSNTQKNNVLKSIELHKSLSLMFLGAIIFGACLMLLSPGRLSNYIYLLIIVHSLLYVVVEKIFFFRIAKGKPISAAFFRSFIAKSIALLAFGTIYFVLEWQNVVILLLAYIVGYSLVLLFHYRYLKFSYFDLQYLNDVKTYYSVQLIYYLPSFLLRVVYTYVAGYVALSYMMIGIILSQSITMIATAMTNQFSPQLRTYYLAGDMLAFKKVLTNSIIIPAGVLVGAIIFVIFNVEHIHLFLGDQYNQDLFYIMLFIIMLGPASNVFSGMTGTALLMSGKQNIEFSIGTVKALVACGIFVSFYYYNPDLSAPVAITVSEVVANILKLVMVQREFKIWVLDSKVIMNLGLQIGVYTLVLTCLDLFLDDGVSKVYVSAAAVSILCFVGLLKMKSTGKP